MENLDKLVLELCKLPNETTYVEFKHNNYNPTTIGEDICALSNSAALYERNAAYMLWGIDDKTHGIIGTKKDLQDIRKGEQELENWLRSLLSANVNFEYHSILLGGKRVGILIIHPAMSNPTTFEKTAYIRIGSYTKKLRDYPAIESQLWDKLRNRNFEEQSAKQDLSLNDALQFLDVFPYFDLQNLPRTFQPSQIAHYLLEENILIHQDNGLYAITNMGAILFAKRLTDFPHLARKAIRLVKYTNKNRLSLEREETVLQGYVTGLERIITYIDTILPSSEPIIGAFRQKKRVYPEIAIREAIANALIHQDFSITGTGPLIEIFPARMEITNPGTPLVDIARIIDNPPKSRNEKLADLMRRLKICEELGSGWDKIVISCELAFLPAPRIDLYEANTRVTLFSERSFRSIAMEDKVRACYMHACVKQVQGEHLTNSSLRTRFGVTTSSTGSISRLIKETISRGLIKPLDPHTAPKHMKYVPWWA